MEKLESFISHVGVCVHTHTHSKESRNNLVLLANGLAVDIDQSGGFQECIKTSKIIHGPVFYLGGFFLMLLTFKMPNFCLNQS